MVACVPTSAAAVGAVALLGVPLTALCLVSPWHSNTEVVAVRSSDDIQWLHYEIMSVIAHKCNLLLKMSISAVCIIYQCDPLCYCYANGHSYEGAADKVHALHWPCLMQIGNYKLSLLGHIRYYMRYYMSTVEAHQHHVLQNGILNFCTSGGGQFSH